MDSTLDLDSHADMAVLGANCRIISHANCSMRVLCYDPSLGPTKREVVSGCFAYDDPTDGMTKLLYVDQGLYVPTMPYSLIPPFQMGVHDIVVNKCPKSQLRHPTENDHAILIPMDGGSYRIPLSLKGTISCIHIRIPTDGEFHNPDNETFTHQGRCFTKLRNGDQKKWHRNFKFGLLAITGASPRAWF
jgi:hypothetical protein